ncbi:MAG: site-specific DNA-methyltransferase [Promethearchaeota archaeon]
MASLLEWKGKQEAYQEYQKIIDDRDLEPFQAIEFVRPSNSNNTIENWHNLLFLGDNKLVMAQLLKKFAGKVNLIYIDPPFATGSEFNYKIQIGEGKESKKSSKWVRKQAYADSWKNGIESYLSFLYKRLLLMKDLLSEEGSIYVHLDWHIGHYIKVMMDEIFGDNNFRNEIVWAYPAASVQTKKFYVRSFDVILYYTKSDNYTFNDDPEIYMEYSDRVKNSLNKDDKGFFYYRGGSHDGKKLSQKVYVKKTGVFPRDVWTDVPYIRANTLEYQGFSTQKPERLLKRILLASTNENDLVADFFCGSGTTLVVAEKLNRRWIGSDVSNSTIHMVKKRLLRISGSNDIREWKKKYNNETKAFKLMILPDNKLSFSKLTPFLAKDVNLKEELKSLDPPSVDLRIIKEGKKIIVELKDYVVPYINLLSPEIRQNIKKFSDWIDYWAIDFDYNIPQKFQVQWVSLRTPQSRNLELYSKSHKYDLSGPHIIMVHLVDFCGVETRWMLKVNVE